MSYDELLRDMERALVAIDASKPYRYEPTTSLPALSPQLQAALDAEAEMVASVVKRAREMVAELEALRADLREAMELLRASRKDRPSIAMVEALRARRGDRDFSAESNARWARTDALLAKHKETNQ